MLLRQLEGFAAAAEEGSISRAAERLFLSQPALTSRLHALETELGAELFHRGARGVELSEIGKAYLPLARRALEAVEQGRQLVRLLSEGLTGTLEVAVAPALSTYVLPPMLKRFRQAHPGIQVSVRTGHPGDIVSLLLHDEVQLGLACDLRHPDLEVTKLLDDELILVAATDYAARIPPRLTTANLADQHVVVFRTSGYEGVVDNLLREAAVPPSNIMEFDSIDATKKMVENGLGVAFLPRVSVDHDLAAGTLVALRLAGTRPMPRSIVALRRRSAGPPNGAAAHFLRVALNGSTDEPGV